MGIFNIGGNLFGKGKTVIGDLVGGDIYVNGKRIEVDGKVITEDAIGDIEITLKEGVLKSVKSSASVTVNGDVNGNVDAKMSVTCGNVAGNVESTMSVTCGNVGGNAKAGMSLTARDIHGDASAGMKLNGRQVR